MAHDAPPRSQLLRRLRLLGLVGPLVFVVTLLAVRPLIIDTFGLRLGHLALGTILLLSAVAFGWAMHWMLGRAHTAVVEAERQSASLLERDRIARELHDSLAQVLGVAHLRLRTLETRPSIAGDDRTRTEIDDLATLCRDAHRDVREAIIGLKDAHRTERTLREQLEAFVASFSRTSGVATTLTGDLTDEPGLSPSAEVQVIRVIQEALSNVRKHADAQHADVRITNRATHTEFVVSDDGTGFDTTRATRSDAFGLTTMRERIESAGGTFHIQTEPGRGTRVLAALPNPRGGATVAPAASTLQRGTAPERVTA